LLEKRDAKVATYSKGIRLVNRLLLKTTELADPDFASKMAKLKGNKYRNEVVFPDPLPQDERRELELAKEKMEMGLSTRHMELEKRGYSQKEIKDIEKESEEEAKKEAEALFDVPPKSGPGKGKFQLERGGPNETRGEKIVATNQRKNSE